MNTYLGACTGLGPDDIDTDVVSAAQVTYVEGYLWDAPEAKKAVLKAFDAAHAAGRLVSITLSDSFCVDRYREEFRDLLRNKVDILFGNEAEITSLYEVKSFDEALEAVRKEARIAALTRSEKGSIVVKGGETHAVPAAAVAKVVDTTGAGDLYAAGFLFGFTHGKPLAECARLGGIAAAEIISHVGARPEQALRGPDLSARRPKPERWRESLAIYAHRASSPSCSWASPPACRSCWSSRPCRRGCASSASSRTAIGFFSWIGITYSIKFVWAPLVDRVPLPLLTRRLGRRRSLDAPGPDRHRARPARHGVLRSARRDLWWLAAFAVVVAFSSATQDIAIDAFRIEATDETLQGADRRDLPARLPHRRARRRRGRALHRRVRLMAGGLHHHGSPGPGRHRRPRC